MVDGSSLENCHVVKDIVGSNPTLSAKYVGYSRVVLRLPVKEKGSGQNRLVTPSNEMWPSGKAPGSEPEKRRFDPYRLSHKED